MRILLIRHGESKHNQLGLIASRTACPGLTEKGFQQAEHLRRRLERSQEAAGCSVLLCSPALRARQTAEVVGSAFGNPPMEILDRLAEIETGEAEGMTSEAYKQRYGSFDPVREPERPFAPGGESWVEYLARVQAVHEQIAERYAGKTVVVVSHAGWIIAGVVALFAIPRPGRGTRLETDYTGITEWLVEQGRWQLARFNDIAHLNFWKPV